LKVLAVQSGGPSPGSNSVLAGVGLSLSRSNDELWGAVGGFPGLIKGDVVKLTGQAGFWQELARSGAPYLRTSRDKLKGALESLQHLDFDGAVVIGGEGTLEFVRQAEVHVHFPLIFVPKTIDNDLGPSHHDLGFPTAATQSVKAAVSVRYDMSSYDGYVDVEILQLMGRDAGWLALSCAAAGRFSPDLYIIPEASPIDHSDELVREVKEAVNSKGKALVAVSEGVGYSADFRLANGGERVRALLEGMKTRVEIPGVLIRTYVPVSIDVREGIALGRQAVDLLRSGRSALLSLLPPDQRRGAELAEPLSLASGVKRVLPRKFFNGFLPTDDFLDYMASMRIHARALGLPPLH